MFETKDEIREKVSQLKKLAAGYDRGSVIAWNLIEAIAGDRFSEGQYVIKKWRDQMLRDEKIAMRRVNGIGLELLTEEEQVTWCPADRRKKMFRQSSRAMRELKFVNERGLSDHYRRIRIMQVEQLKDERKEMRRGLNLFRKAESKPRPVSA